MLKMFVLSLVILSLVSPSFAGGFKTLQKDINRVDEYVAPMPEEPGPRVQYIRSEKIVEKAAPKEKPSQGFAIGFHGAIPTLILNLDVCDVELGYTNLNNNQAGLLKAAIPLYRSNEDYTVIKGGVSLMENNGSAIGVYLGAEQYIEKNVSVTGDIYLASGGNGVTNLLTSMIGARLYF